MDHPPIPVLEEIRIDEERILHGIHEAHDAKAGPVRGTTDRDRAGSGAIQLAPGRAELVQFRYTAPTFVNAARVRFRHRLLGLDDRWHDAGEDRTATFTTLAPRQYTFEVSAVNAHGIWSDSPARFSFSLAPGFTETDWFPASLTLGGFALASGILAVRLRWQRRSLRAEHATTLAEERARIAQDLHDDLGTALTGVALQLDVLGTEKQPLQPSDPRIGNAAMNVRAQAARMREVVWAVNPQCDSLNSLAGFLEEQVGSLLASAGIEPHLDFPEQLPDWPLGSKARYELALAVREILVNTVRHSGATEMHIRLRCDPGDLVIDFSDNGRGFDPALHGKPGHGLHNIRLRLEKLGGVAEVESRPGAGTRVSVRLPVPGQGGALP